MTTESPTPASTDTPPSAGTTDAPPAAAPEVAPVAPAASEEGDLETVLGGAAPEAGGEGKVEGEGEAKPEGEEAPPAGAPEAYELSLEGVTLDTELVAAAEPIFRELNLTNDQANALLPLAPQIMEKAQASVVQHLIEQGASQRKGWHDAFKADPDIGGAKMEESAHLAAKGLDGLGFKATGFGEGGKDPHPFRAALNETGFGNHPDMIRAFRAIGEMMGEDGLFPREGAAPRENIPAHKALYPNET
ncbi:hypothetical protein FHW96_000284 [Novosphingobium sp. SG751A]|uniref:hypothetical protein n=1 Tax=Novosphingobium sp. SG751A TaxID=2587000 RepID=UPI001551C74E|nr:hypothetical protein [Novosphingobium sp. SG751A]NOW44157.1 hypothetical protein [Novosphingobium sp. SG751A]